MYVAPYDDENAAWADWDTLKQLAKDKVITLDGLVLVRRDDDDWTQAHDLATEQPEKLEQLKQLFRIEAAKHNVLPLDDRMVERVNPELAGPSTCF